MTGLGGSNLGFSSGLFDFGPAHAAQATSNVKDVEICRLREELGAARAKLHSWEESMGQARTACAAWKKEAAIANKKAEMAIKEREVALNKAVQLQKELEQLSGGPLLHALRRIADLPNLPPAVLKTLDWTLEQPPVGEHGLRVAEPEHPAAEHQRVGAGLEHAAPLQPALSTPVEPWKS